MEQKIKKSPIQYLAALALILGGAGITFISHPSAPLIGSVFTAIGGALLSSIVSAVGNREAAQTYLEPELQSMSRHLADTIAKLSRITQDYESDRVPSDIAMDRVSQLKSTFYASLHDLSLLCGSVASFETLVDTVQVCENTAAKLAEITVDASSPGVAAELATLREQLEVARSQLSQASDRFTTRVTSKRREVVKCPECGEGRDADISVKPGPGVTVRCGHCDSQFHAHRLADGGVGVTPWGGASALKKVFTSCDSCGFEIPVAFKSEEEEQVRFCLICSRELIVNRNGKIASSRHTTPLLGTELVKTAGRDVMRCPGCTGDVPVLITRDSMARGVCFECQKVVHHEA